jgi:hypothetical protein
MWIDSQQLVFLDGAGLAVCSLALARLIPGKMRMEKRGE